MKRTGAARASLEAALPLAAFHLWLLSLDGLPASLRVQGAVFACLLAGAWIGLRARPAWMGRLLATIAVAAPPVLIETIADRRAMAPAAFAPWVIAGEVAVLLAARAIGAWSRLHARSLVWSLAHAHLKVIAAMLAIAVVAFAIRQSDSSFVRGQLVGLPADAALAVRVVAGALPVLVMLAVICALALPLVLPPALLLSWLAARGLARRVEELTAIEAAAKARRELFARVSHELKNPLAALRSAVDGLRARSRPAAELDVLDAGVGRMARIAGDLATLARAEVGRLEIAFADVDVAGSIRSILAAERAAADAAEVALIADVDASAIVRLDCVRFEQVLANLVANALRHVEPGGMVRASLQTGDGRAVVAVEDTGCGIDARSLPRVFQPGFSGDGGLGLGLAVAKELTERMGGAIAIESRPGAGTRVTLSFDCREATNAPRVRHTSSVPCRP